MEINFKIDKENCYILETWPKIVTIEDYAEMKNKQFSSPDFRSEYNVITDLRNVDMKFDELFVMRIAKFMKEHTKQMKNRKSAVVANSPQLVASSIFFLQKIRNLSVKASVFSTLDAAIKWTNEKWH